jgi:xylulose-5-phosphate/fructose-6-phosphate phosphoketolase
MQFYSVLAGIGVEVTFEVIAAAALLRKYVPALRVRVVNVTDLMIMSPLGTHPHSLSDADFNALFTPDRPVHFNYHGYPIELKGLLAGRPRLDRVSVAGYNEEGTTTSPFDVRAYVPASMHVLGLEHRHSSDAVVQ